ncbi:hypothetical protein [Kutzneria buriramensis]|uniref:Uncharacterized protein n=1 Tax=Kutzneria buriramensis TaxID=1045776 RepID=A0A3E0H115_9PSEU|nr:hypothetical protein [Kutzneria buriramensis]REH36216.1 hypothetical protein BCF44_11685 [Kutzneria buriramensis]
MSETQERRLRRLLALYPRDHREAHGEEMLGVLLDSSPGWRDGLNLVGGAIALHARRLLGLDGGVNRRDVLAVVGLLGPLMILTAAVGDLHEVAWFTKNGGLADMPLSQVPDAPVWAVWLVVAGLVLFGLRRTAAVFAWLADIVHLVIPYKASNWTWSYESKGWLLLGLVTAIALTWSAGPARGRKLVGRRGIVLTLATVAVAMSCQLFAPRFVMIGRWPLDMSEWLVYLALAGGACLACRSVPNRRTGRRAAFVLALPAVAFALEYVEVTIIGPPLYWVPAVEATVLYGIPVLLVLAGNGVLRPIRRTA